mgnify:CR=1 FL=1|tara:strand:+ start:9805 stop:10056 length:252 start_codon:yes stop_codon:yes gene_type:complete
MNIFTSILINFIKLYKFLISPLIGNNCRYLPTCSDYSIEAIKSYGPIKGLLLSFKRIFSCHPIKFLGGGEGFDPLIKKVKEKK